MYLIDQHAAHERILYEQMMADHVRQQAAVQPLLEPAVLDLSPEVAAIAADAIGALADLGLALEPFGGSSYLLRSVPAVLAARANPSGPRSKSLTVSPGRKTSSSRPPKRGWSH